MEGARLSAGLLQRVFKLKFQYSEYSGYFVNIQFLSNRLRLPRMFLPKRILMKAELKENETICFENCCRLELMNRQNVPK